MTRSLSVVGLAAIAVAIMLAVTTGCKKPEPTTGGATPPSAVSGPSGDQPGPTTSGAPPPSAVSGPSGDAADVEQATCPVMGRTMAKADMVPVTYEGKTYYLCCAGCKPKFDADPEKYIGVEGQPEEGSAMEHEGGDEEGEHEHGGEEGESGESL